MIRSGDDEASSFSLEYAGGRITAPDEASVRRAVAEIESGRARRARWPLDGREAMAALARIFPSMHDIPGANPWAPEVLIEWLNGPAPGSGAASAGRFLLGVWNPGTNWNDVGLAGPGRFDLFEAMAVWDAEHVRAFVHWIEAPFWP